MARTKKRTYRRRYKKFKIKPQTLISLLALVCFAGSALIGLSFGQQGVLLYQLNTILTHYVGWTVIMLPILLVFYGFLLLGGKWFLALPNMSIGLTLCFGVLLILTQAGIIGEEVWFRLTLLLSAPGSFVLLLGVLIVGMAVSFNISLSQLVDAVIVVGELIWGTVGSILRPGTSNAPTFTTNEKTALKVKGGTPFPVHSEKDIKVIAPSLGKDGKQDKSANTKQTSDLSRSHLIVNDTSNKNLEFWEYPPLTLLSDAVGGKADRGDLKKNAVVIERTLDSFGIAARVVEVNLGPAVTQYALEIALGTKVSKLTSLSNDLALALAAPTGQIRIEAPIPGRSLVGIEIPNRSLEFVTLRKMLESDSMRKAKSKLTVAMGLDVSGTPLVADLAKMPHVLIAGTTGSGKSVMLNSFICSLLFRTTPLEVKMILIDPKRVELIGYNGIPHLLTPVIVETDKILSSLKWATHEMDRRYKLFSEVGVRNIDSYNELSGFQALPFIIVLVDELADLMAFAAVEVEDAICRLAQMARATGIHLVVATQRPSVDVITGLIKANIPSRIAFNVSSMVDSRVIIDGPGAEKLLGRGDMLYIPPDQAKPSRVQGTFVSEGEVRKLVDFLKNKNAPVEYTQEVISLPVGGGKKGGTVGTGSDNHDGLFDESVRVVCQYDRASASLLQRRLSVGYARAARILDQLEAEGIVGPAEGSKPREVLMRDPGEYFAKRDGGETSA